MSKIYKPASVLAPHIKGLLSEKTALGYCYRTEARVLFSFDRYCLEHGLNTVSVTRDFLGGWMEQSDSEGLFNHAKRISVVRQLLIYVASLGIQVYIPYDFCHFEKKLPHILTQGELDALFFEIDAYIPCQINNRNLLRLSNEYKVLFRMIYSCGLRNSEGAGIAVSNVDMEAGVLTILNAKGQKDRLVYISDDLKELCKKYYRYICGELGMEPEWFFPSLDPTRPLKNQTVARRFAEAWARTSFAASCNDKPVVHDLRFTFVTKRINQWMEEGKDINVLLPYLAKFLGHKSISGTHYYYHLTLDAARIIKSRDSIGPGAIPEVASYE